MGTQVVRNAYLAFMHFRGDEEKPIAPRKTSAIKHLMGMRAQLCDCVESVPICAR